MNEIIMNVAIRGARFAIPPSSETFRVPILWPSDPAALGRPPARMAEPPVGVSTWASGSHVCNGHVGSFVPKAIRRATNIRSPIVPAGIGVVAIIARMSNGQGGRDDPRAVHGVFGFE